MRTAIKGISSVCCSPSCRLRFCYGITILTRLFKLNIFEQVHPFIRDSHSSCSGSCRSTCRHWCSYTRIVCSSRQLKCELFQIPFRSFRSGNCFLNGDGQFHRCRFIGIGKVHLRSAKRRSVGFLKFSLQLSVIIRDFDIHQMLRPIKGIARDTAAVFHNGILVRACLCERQCREVYRLSIPAIIKFHRHLIACRRRCAADTCQGKGKGLVVFALRNRIAVYRFLNTKGHARGCRFVHVGKLRYCNHFIIAIDILNCRRRQHRSIHRIRGSQDRIIIRYDNSDRTCRIVLFGIPCITGCQNIIFPNRIDIGAGFGECNRIKCFHSFTGNCYGCRRSGGSAGHRHIQGSRIRSSLCQRKRKGLIRSRRSVISFDDFLDRNLQFNRCRVILVFHLNRLICRIPTYVACYSSASDRANTDAGTVYLPQINILICVRCRIVRIRWRRIFFQSHLNRSFNLRITIGNTDFINIEFIDSVRTDIRRDCDTEGCKSVRPRHARC